MAFFHSLDKAAVEPLSFIYRLIMSDPGPAASRKGVGVEGEEWVSGWEHGAYFLGQQFDLDLSFGGVGLRQSKAGAVCAGSQSPWKPSNSALAVNWSRRGHCFSSLARRVPREYL